MTDLVHLRWSLQRSKRDSVHLNKLDNENRYELLDIMIEIESLMANQQDSFLLSYFSSSSGVLRLWVGWSIQSWLGSTITNNFTTFMAEPNLSHRADISSDRDKRPIIKTLTNSSKEYHISIEKAKAMGDYKCNEVNIHSAMQVTASLVSAQEETYAVYFFFTRNLLARVYLYINYIVCFPVCGVVSSICCIYWAFCWSPFLKLNSIYYD